MAALALTLSALYGSRNYAPLAPHHKLRQSDGHVSHLKSSFTPRGIAVSIQRLKRKEKRSRLQVHAAKIAIPNHGYDYYELLGVDPGASTMQIKQSYRWLQKRCHPDVAGGVGHDMSILLNEAYSTLTDLNARVMYDQIRVTWLEDDAFSGKPVWSTWLGSSEEDQAVFVDESQCIGCLKCAMIAENTFAIESTHGRARAIWQWGDDEATLEDAISACPVDCIKWVERSKLAALEHIMSNMPRMNVGLANHAAEGKRSQEDVFQETDRFLHKRSLKEAARQATQPTPGERDSAIAAAEAILARSGRWWRPANRSGQSTSASWQAALQLQGALIPSAWVTTPQELEAARVKRGAGGIPEELRRLHEVAQKRASNGTAPGGKQVWSADSDEEYWTPMEPISCPVSFPTPDQTLPHIPREPFPAFSEGSVEVRSFGVGRGGGSGMGGGEGMDRMIEILMRGIPVVTSLGAAVVVGLTSGGTSGDSVTGVKAFLPLDVIGGTAFQVLCAAVVWYALGAAFSGSLFLMQSIMIKKKEVGDKEEGGINE